MIFQVKNKFTNARQYFTLEPQNEPIQKLGFTFNPMLMGIISIVLSFPYFSFEQHRINFFVYFSLIIDLLHPIMVKALRKNILLKQLILQGSFLPSLLSDIWTLFYPQKTYVYYIPLLISLTSKLIDLIVEAEWRVQVTQELCKFQSKIELLVVIFCFIGTITKLKFIWFKIIKFFAILLIFRLKYWRHYGCQLAMNQIHFSLDYVAKCLLLRQHYQQFYSKLVLFGNEFNSHQQILL